MFHRIKSLFPKELQKRGLFKGVRAAQIVNEWPKVIEQINPVFLHKTKATTFKAGVLTVLCQHGIVAQEIELQKEKIISLYQKVFPGQNFRLRLRIGAWKDPEQQKPSQ